MLKVALLALLACVAAEVLVLNEGNFDDTLKENSKVLVEFYAPWCGHCKALAPEYEKAAEALGKDGVLAKVDCTENESICKKQGVQGYPTLKWFVDGAPSEYNGPREAAGIESWIRKRSAPATVLADAAAVAEFTKEKNAVVGFFAEGHADAGAFNTLRNEYDEFDFAVCTDASVAKAEGVSDDAGIKIYTKHGVQHVADGDAAGWGAAIDAHGYPLITDIQQNRFPKLAESKKYVVVLFTGKDATADIDLVTKVGQKHAEQLGFVSGEGEQYAQHASQLGISGKKFPVLVAIAGQKYLPSDEDQDFTEETVGAYLQGLVDGTIKPKFKSEETPTDNDGPVRVLVGNTFDEEVIKSDNDVLVEFYAPWCGHCKSLAPIYEKLGEKFAKNSKIVIAKIDATANDHPIDGVEGFPTLKFFKAGSKDSPIDYNGGRTLDDLTKFVKENAANLSAEEKEEL